MDIVIIISRCFKQNRKWEVKFLVVLEYMLHGGCRRVSKVISLALEPISRFTVYELARRVSTLSIAHKDVWL